MNQILRKTKLTGAAVAPYRFVKKGADDDHIVQASAASDAIIGISGEIALTAAEQRVDFGVIGIEQLELGGTVALGDTLTADANGKGVVAATTNRIGAVAMAGGVAGDIIDVLVTLGHRP